MVPAIAQYCAIRQRTMHVQTLIVNLGASHCFPATHIRKILIRLTESCHAISRICIEHSQIQFISHMEDNTKLHPEELNITFAELNQTVNWTADQMNQNS